MIQYRNNGAIGAILDEYKRAIVELKAIVKNLDQDKLVHVFDEKTNDPDCRSIQSVLTHVIQSGYQYVISMRNHLGESLDKSRNTTLYDINEYLVAIDEMFDYNVNFFVDYPNIEIEEHDPNKKIHVSWGQKYDIEQLLEHAIVHVLRHRRQIQIFLSR